jgi:hypothetical protein
VKLKAKFLLEDLSNILVVLNEEGLSPLPEIGSASASRSKKSSIHKVKPSQNIPWDKGYAEVKRHLEKKYKDVKTIVSVLNRAGANLEDPKKIKIKDQVLKSYQHKVERPSEGTKKAEKPSELVKPKSPKPNLEMILKTKEPRLSEKEKKEVIDTAHKVMPQIKKRVQSFTEKHPILKETLRGAAISGVVALATATAIAATGGAAVAVLPALMASGTVIATSSAAGGLKGGLTQYISDRLGEKHKYQTHGKLAAETTASVVGGVAKHIVV